MSDMDYMVAWPNLVHLALVALTQGFGAHLIHDLWVQQENYRWTWGYAVAFAMAAYMVSQGYWPTPWAVWMGCFATVGMSAVGKLGYLRIRDSLEARRLRRWHDGQARK